MFQGTSESTAAVQTEGTTAYTLVDGALLTSVPGAQTLRVEGDGQVFAAYGRTPDVQAWLSDVAYTAVTVDAEGVVQTTEVEPTAEGTAGATARSPINSDLWLDEYEQTGTLSATLQLPGDMSVLIASDGTAPAPANVSVTWPIDDSTPWAGPLIVGGGIVLLAGLVLYLICIRHVRCFR